MALIELNKDPGKKELIVFGTLWLLFFAFFATNFLLRDNPGLATLFALVATCIPLIGLIWNPFQSKSYLGTAYLTYPIGWVISNIILILLFYFVFTIMSVVIRILKIDPMKRGWEKKNETYWITHKPAKTLRRYFQQF